MIYFTTGGNGAGKTLFTLADVRAQQLKENRPVYYHGFEALQPIKDFGWLPFEPQNWQDLPDGSICIFDECQNEFPAKVEGKLPDYINAVAQFRRKRGFDFWMIAPHPSLVHLNIRRLIESPSWHRHMKRTMGADMVSELRFNFANTNCEKPSAGAAGTVSMRSYPKEVYSWYKSASLHTGKKTIPRQVYVLAAAALLIPLLFYYGYSSVTKKAHVTNNAQVSGPVSSAFPSPSGSATPADYFGDYQPRIAGLPHTAPRFDEITKPVHAPYPAACVKMGSRCGCYTQQGTALDTPAVLCAQIVKTGYFVEWQAEPSSMPRVSPAGPSSGVPVASSGALPVVR